MKNVVISDLTLHYFDIHQRVLPWRGVNDPYKTWLSEVMLQQTTVKTVTPYFEKFIAKWATVHELANAPLEDVLREWAGLGYYSRARNLHACAQQLSLFFPNNAAGLVKLKGIGAYTSAAIASIAFHEPIAVVDGNVERVWGRFRAINGLENVRADLQKEVPLIRPGDFAECLMDLGATICTPRNPVCSLCPLNSHCIAYKTDKIAEYPAKKLKKTLPEKRALCFVYRSEGRVLVETRPDKGLLGGMSGLPCSPWVLKDEFEFEIALEGITHYSVLNTHIRHIFTHFALELTPVLVHEPRDGRYVDPHDNNEAFPTLFKKLLASLSLE